MLATAPSSLLSSPDPRLAAWAFAQICALYRGGGGALDSIMEACAGQGGKLFSFPDQTLPSFPEQHGEIPTVSGNSGG